MNLTNYMNRQNLSPEKLTSMMLNLLKINKLEPEKVSKIITPISSKNSNYWRYCKFDFSSIDDVLKNKRAIHTNNKIEYSISFIIYFKCNDKEHKARQLIGKMQCFTFNDQDILDLDNDDDLLSLSFSYNQNSVEFSNSHAKFFADQFFKIAHNKTTGNSLLDCMTKLYFYKEYGKAVDSLPIDLYLIKEKDFIAEIHWNPFLGKNSNPLLSVRFNVKVTIEDECTRDYFCHKLTEFAYHIFGYHMYKHEINIGGNVNIIALKEKQRL